MIPRGAIRLITLLIAAGLIAYSLSSLRFESRSVLFETRVVAQAEAGERRASNLAKLRLLTRSVGFIRSNYVSPDRIRPVPMLLGALKSVEALIPEMMAVAEPEPRETAREVSVRVGDQRRTFSLAGISDLYEMNWRLLDIFDFIAANLPEDAKEDEVEYAAINGLLSPLDEHSVYLPPRAYQEMKLDTEGRFGGLGIVITTRGGVVTIVSVLPDTPADRAGLKSLDQITDIGDETTLNMPLNDAVSKLRGEPGTRVTIRVQRKGWPEPRTFTLKREEIHVESVSSEVLGNGVGYVRLRHFQEDTSTELERHLRALKAKKSLNYLILDLRENPGGLLEQSVEVADLFVRKGTLVITEGEGNRMRQEYRASSDARFADVPMVVLVDGGTASAAEIVAAALKGNDRAVLIGDTTFGKGTVQVLYEVGEGALKLTVAQYLTPGGWSIQGVGIAPDVDLVPVRLAAGEESLGTREQREERDPKRKLRPFGPVPDEEPLVHLPVIVEAEEQEEDDEAEEPPVREDRFERDEVIDLSEAIVRGMKSPSRRAGLREAEPVLKEILGRQDQRIVEGLKADGIDWTAGPVQTGNPVEVTWRLDHGRVLQAGSRAKVRLQVRNRSSEPLYRVHVTTVSENPTLDGLEFVFGRLDPGQSLTRERTIRVPSDAWDRLDRVDFAVYQDHLEGLKPAPVLVGTQGLPRPRFSYSIRIQDGAGNGDGMIQAGETVDALVEIRNLGEGAARDVLATLRNRNRDGVYVRQGRATFKEIAAGKSVEARFTFEVRPGAALSEVRFEVGLLDRKVREYLAEERSFRVAPGKGKPFLAGPRALRTLRDGTPLYNEADPEGSVRASLEQGFYLRGLGRIGDFYRVEVDDAEFAFVRASDVEPLNEVVRYPPLPPVERGWAVMPAIRMGPLPVGEEQPPNGLLTVAGQVRFEGADDRGAVRRKILVFRGDDKVFFWARSGGKDPEEVPFEAAVTLQPGRNDVAIYAIDGKERSTLRRFTIFAGSRLEQGVSDALGGRGGGLR